MSAGGDAFLELQRLGLPARPIESFVDFGWIDRINALSAELARGWLREAGADTELVTELGRMLELPLYHVVSEAARSILLAQRLLEETDDGFVIAGARDFPAPDFWVGFWLSLKAQALALVAAQTGRSVEYVSEALPAPSAPPPAAIRLVRRLEASIRWRLAAPARRREISRLRSPPAPLPDCGDRAVVLVYAEGRHILPLMSVIARLAGDSRYVPIVLDQDLAPDARRTIEQLGVGLADPRAAAIEQPPADRLWPAHDALGSVESVFAQAGEREFGVSLWPLVRFQVEWLLDAGTRFATGRLRLARETLRRLRPALLLTPVDTSVNDLAWVVAAQESETPVVVQLHGAVYVRPGKDLWGRGEGDLTAVWGAVTSDWHVQATSRPESAFPCVGYPRLDELAALAPSLDRESAKRRLGLEGRRVVVFLVSMATGALGSYFASQVEVYATFFEALEQLDGVSVLVRVHPASDGRLAELAVAHTGVHARLVQEGELVPLLEAADVVVGQPTTALVEAMVIERPVVVFAAEMSDQLLWWNSDGLLTVARDATGLAEALRALLEDPAAGAAALEAQRAFLDRYAGPRDGDAAARTVALLESLYPA